MSTKNRLFLKANQPTHGA